MGNRQDYLKKEIVKFCFRLDQKCFGANHDGNISVKFDENLLETPTSISKGLMTVEQVITLDRNGNKVDGIGKPFSEIKLHLAAYQSRSDVEAVIHAHPPYATARGLVGEGLRPQIPEAIVSIGDLVPVVPFAMPGDLKNDSIVAEALSLCDVFMMPGNGLLSVGR